MLNINHGEEMYFKYKDHLNQEVDARVVFDIMLYRFRVFRKDKLFSLPEIQVDPGDAWKYIKDFVYDKHFHYGTELKNYLIQKFKE